MDLQPVGGENDGTQLRDDYSEWFSSPPSAPSSRANSMPLSSRWRLDPSSKNEEAGVCDHAVHRAQPRRLGFVVAQQDLADFDECKAILTQRRQQILDLIESRHDRSQRSAGFQRGAHLTGVVPGVGHVEKERIRVRLIHALSDVTEFEIHARRQTDPLKILAGKILHVLADLVGRDMAFRHRRRRRRRWSSSLNQFPLRQFFFPDRFPG